jgi:hypothetical protein
MNKVDMVDDEELLRLRWKSVCYLSTNMMEQWTSYSRSAFGGLNNDPTWVPKNSWMEAVDA